MNDLTLDDMAEENPFSKIQREGFKRAMEEVDLR